MHAHAEEVQPEPTSGPSHGIVPFRDPQEIVSEKLSDFSHVTWEWQDIKTFTIERIGQIIADQGIAPDNLSSPRSDIAVPAIEAMRYSQLRHEIVFLIASTMDAERTEIAHPAFIEIIKQLTPDEIRLLAALPAEEHVIPLLNINFVDQIDRIKLAIRFVIPAPIAAACGTKRAIPRYMDNLLRLKLIESPSGLKITDNTYYENLLNDPFLKSPHLQPPKHLRKTVEKRVLRLTSFGASFRSCCIDQQRLPAIGV